MNFVTTPVNKCVPKTLVRQRTLEGSTPPRKLVLMSLSCWCCLTNHCWPDTLPTLQPYGMNSRPNIGAFLDGRMPEASRDTSSAWTAVVAFPNLSFINPVGLTPVPGTNRLCVWEQEGKVYTFENSAAVTEKQVILDISSQCQGWSDSGLLGLAFHPGFATNRYVFVWYVWVPPGTVQGGPTKPPPLFTANRKRLSRFTCDRFGVVMRKSETVLVDQNGTSLWHNGGGMFFHPGNGFLYLSVGDDNKAANTQQIDQGLFSGILRIDVDQRWGTVSHPIRQRPRNGNTGHYFIPNDNPFVGQSNVLEEFYALGLRNPHRISYDTSSRRIFIGDVGDSMREEIDVIEPTDPAGLNFQWDRIEGLRGDLSPPYPGVSRKPIFDYDHSDGLAIIGGYVYRGKEFANELGGKYVFGDNPTRKIWALDESCNPPRKRLLCIMPKGEGPESNHTGLSSLGIDQEGELYLCQLSSIKARIYKLQRKTSPEPTRPLPPLLSQTGAFKDTASLSPGEGLIPYTVNVPFWSDGAEKRRWIAIPRNERIRFAASGEWSFPAGTVFVKHFDLTVDEVHADAAKRLETRFLVLGTNGAAYGVTYKWRADGRDADLLTNSLTEHVVESPSHPEPWYYPGPDDCLRCHTSAAGYVLGVNTRQINGHFRYPDTGVTDNQLRVWNHLGLFDRPLQESEIGSLVKLVPLNATDAPLEQRIRSFLDANCAQCHRPGNAPAFWDARFDTPLGNQNIIGGLVAKDLGIGGARVVVPGTPAASMLEVRIKSLEPTIQMPPLARNRVNGEAAAAIEEWIDGLPRITNALPSPWAAKAIGFLKAPGGASYHDGTFTVSSAGSDIWNAADSFQYVFLPWSGDGEIRARVVSIDRTHPWAKGGIMIRETMRADSAYAFALASAGEEAAFQRRMTTRDDSVHSGGPRHDFPCWLRLVRSGNNFKSYVSDDGVRWESLGSDRIGMSKEVLVGLAVTAHNDAALCKAVFDNVSTSAGAPVWRHRAFVAFIGILTLVSMRPLRQRLRDHLSDRKAQKIPISGAMAFVGVQQGSPFSVPKRWHLFLGLFALLFFAVTYVHQKKFDSATPASRLDLLHSMMKGTFSIDAYSKNTTDKAVFGGHRYSDKAPGTVALSLPAFTAAAGLLKAMGIALDSGDGWLVSSWIACAGSIGIVTALGGVALFAWLSRYVPQKWALITTLALFLGAAPLPYATMMFSHAWVVGLLAIAIWAIERQGQCAIQNETQGVWFRIQHERWALLAGFASGLCLSSEYSAGLVVMGLFFWLLLLAPRRIIWFCAGAIPPLLLIPAYSWACFGDPFTLPYSHQATFPEMKEGLYAIKWPDPETAIKLLFSPARGLLFWTPFLLMAALGYHKLFRDSPTIAWLTYLVSVLHVLIISGRVWDWPAGPTLGPRLLAPVIPLLALPCAYGLKRFPKMGVVLAGYSIVITTLATLTDACPSFNDHPNPLFDLHIPLILKSNFSPNLGIILADAPPYLSIVFYYAVLILGIGYLWIQLDNNSASFRKLPHNLSGDAEDCQTSRRLDADARCSR